MCYQAIEDLLGYALRTELIEECDRTWAANRLLQTLGLESWEPPQTVRERPLEDILKELLDDAAARGVIQNDITSRDLFDTELARQGLEIRPFLELEDDVLALRLLYENPAYMRSEEHTSELQSQR